MENNTLFLIIRILIDGDPIFQNSFTTATSRATSARRTTLMNPNETSPAFQRLVPGNESASRQFYRQLQCLPSHDETKEKDPFGHVEAAESAVV